MAALTFVGCLVIAFGPALVFLFGIVARRSQLTVFAVTAAFFELLALLLSSLIWYGMPAAFAGRAALSLVISVLLQEAARFSFVLGYGRVEEALIKASGVASLPFTDFSSAISSGFGFGLLVALVTYGDVLVASLGEADYFIPSCPSASLFVMSAFCALALQLLHVALMILAFAALRTLHRSPRRRAADVLLVVALHLAASVATLANGDVSLGCAVGMSLYFIVISAAFALSLFVAKTHQGV